jgi:starch-binding outer membrane protein, SusD/RagB family
MPTDFRRYLNTMRTSKRLGGLVAGVVLVLASGACQSDLDITNPNNPDVERALATAEDVQNISTSTLNSWYLASTNVYPYMMLGVTADVLSANFGNFGMRFNNLEPRIAYENNSAGGDRAVTEEPWEDNYSTIGAANDVIRVMRSDRFEEGEIGPEYEHVSMFTRAASLTNLALIFDRAFVVNDQFDPETDPKPELLSFDQVADSASKWWDELIAATAGKTYSLPANALPLVPGPLTAVRLNRIANTMHALLLAYTPRRAADVAAVDWDKVKSLAEKGIGTGTAGTAFDVVVQGDFNNWWSYINYYGNEPSWVRVDLRLINRMDPSQPARFTGTIVPRGTSPDKRYTTDFTHAGGVIGDPGRGIYMQSYWWHNRYEHHRRFSPTAAATPVPYLLAAESDLVLAEALIRTGGSLVEAATLINKTRVTRGELPAATAAEGATKLLEYIDYEREIELLNSSGMAHFRRRHVDGLQAGTARHLPIPAKELETLVLPIYSFGGAGKEM